MRTRGVSVWLPLALASLVVAGAAHSDTSNYTYDALGRLAQVCATASTGSTSAYSYDPADNRSNVTVATGASCISFSVNDVQTTEGGNLILTVTKSGTATGTTTVNYAIAAGTATAGSDYDYSLQPQTGTLSFASGVSTQTVTVHTIDDATVESAETLLVNLSNPSAGTVISDSQGTGTIIDNDTAAPGFSIDDVSVTEGGLESFTITRTGSTSGTNSVNFATANGTATAGSDYTAVGTTAVTFAPTDVTKSVSVQTTDDAVVENSETVLMNLSGATGGATISDSQGVGTILDNDSAPPPDFTINDVSVTEGGLLTFTIIKNGTTSSSYSLDWATANGTATAGSDYTAVTTTTVTFAPSDALKSISVSTIDDAATESSETVLVNLSNVTGNASISDSQGVGTILDNENQAPTPVNDTGSQQKCTTQTYNVTANDSDPEGDYPLTVTGVTGAGFSVSSSSELQFTSTQSTGAKVGTYTVRDSRGATANATLTVTVSGGGQCQ